MVPEEVAEKIDSVRGSRDVYDNYNYQVESPDDYKAMENREIFEILGLPYETTEEIVVQITGFPTPDMINRLSGEGTETCSDERHEELHYLSIIEGEEFDEDGDDEDYDEEE
jgi:hypothetical protein